jgi:hypothetical protein
MSLEDATRKRDEVLRRLRAHPDLDELSIAARDLAYFTAYFKRRKLREQALEAFGALDQSHPQHAPALEAIKSAFAEVDRKIAKTRAAVAHEAEREARRAEMVEYELDRRAARREADQLEAEAAATGRPAMDIGPLTALLDRPDEAQWRIAGLLPAEGRAIVVAPNKTGKTTLLGDLIRSLVKGEPFLGRFEVEPLDGDVLLLNYEVSAAQQGRWLADLGLSKKQTARVHVANLRGTENPLSTERGRLELTTYMREHRIAFLIVDPFGRAYNGDQDSNSAVGPWLTTLDELATSGGAREVVLAVHAGWGGTERGQGGQVRARGASALHDWPDAIWRLSRDGEARFFEAEGRDVLFESDRLAYEPNARRLALTGTGGRTAARRATKATELAEPILTIVRNTQGIGASGIGDALRMQGIPFSKGDESAAITALVSDRSILRFRDGKVWRHYTPGNVPPGVGPTTL